jgi:ABC-2 type transport system ATP-binding protein
MIAVENLSKVYGNTCAIEDVTFEVQPGEILGFLGPNGAGKTTTMRILAGYLTATSGTATIAGYEVHDQSLEVRKNIGYLPEIPPLYPDMTVQQFLSFVAQIKGVQKKARRDRIAVALESCQIQDKADVLIRKLSKGYKQRVGIAQAIVHDPPVIILDEPTVGLDPRQISEVRHLIKSLAQNHTIILSSHILPEVSLVCDRVTIINQGQVVVTDTPANLATRLMGHSGYGVELSGDLDHLTQQLRQLPGVVNIDRKNQAESGDRAEFMISTDGSQEWGAVICQTIVNEGGQVWELKRSKVSLEEVFLNLTTSEPELDNSSSPPSEEAEPQD